MRTGICVLALVALLTMFAGCGSSYTIVLKDGTTIKAVDEPEFDESSGFYEYETDDGRENKVNKDVVAEIKEH